MPKPTVLLNLPAQPPARPTGVGRFGLALASRLVERGAFTYVLRTAYPREALPVALAKSAIEVITTEPVDNHIGSVIWQTLIGRWRYPASRYDLVLNLDPYGTGSGGRRRATVIHDLYFKSIPDCIPPRARLTTSIVFAIILRGSDRIVAISKTTGDDIARFFPWSRSRLKTIYSDSTLAIPMDKTRAPSPVDHPYVLAVANVTRNKNLEVLAEAMVRLNAAHPEIGLVHVGGDPNHVLNGVFERAGAPVRLTRLSGLDDAALTALYQNALCLCVPSLYEGFCLPIVEAQKLDCPVVFSNRSAAAEVGGDGGLSFDPLDPEALAGHLADLAEQPGLRERLVGEGALNAERFSWDRAAEQYEALFAEMIGADTARP